MPLEYIPPIDERPLADALASMPLISRQYVTGPYFGGILAFMVVGTLPAVTDDVEAVIVTQKTVFEI